jgi:predicted RNA-binding Zn-ribbon protein involved in translation (DUF1610 family)
MPSEPEEAIEVTCPECGAKVKISERQAERDMKAKCPNGHEVPLAKAI